MAPDRARSAHFGTDVTRLVLGRPARFADEPLDDEFAEQRLARAAGKAGFDEVTFLPEPVAAAREFGAGLARHAQALAAGAVA